MNHFRLKQAQKGAALLVLLLLLFTTYAAFFLSSTNNVNLDQKVANAKQQQLVLAKQTLLAFSMSFADNFAGGSPGRFPCPDSDDDAEGLPNSPCNVSNLPGRLPRRIDIRSGAPFMFSEEGMLNDQRLWLAVSPVYRQSSTAVLNSDTAGMLTLDGQGDIVAMLIAPGVALPGQTRPNNTASNYLESTNSAGMNFVSGLPAYPAELNDRLLPIYRHEVMTLVTVHVVQVIRRILDTYHPANGNTYPTDEPAFQAALTAAPPPAWFTANNWSKVVNYGFVDANTLTISFDGCSITYTVTFGQPDIARSQSSCEV